MLAGGSITATYANTPVAGKTITATYRYSASGLSGALAAGSEQWLELTVNGVAQSPRQKVLAVPFALTSQVAVTAQTAASAMKLVQKTGLTSPLISFSILSGGGGEPRRAVFQLPLQYTTPDNGSSSYKLQRILDTQNISAINSLTVDVEGNSGSGDAGNINYPNPYSTKSYVKLSLVSYSIAGDRVVLAEQTITASDGTISLSGPFQTNDQGKEYAVELEMGIFNTINYSGWVAGVHFRAGAVQMNYDSK